MKLSHYKVVFVITVMQCALLQEVYATKSTATMMYKMKIMFIHSWLFYFFNNYKLYYFNF